MSSLRTAPVVLLLLAGGCHRTIRTPTPPRVEGPATLPTESSTIVVPVSASLADVQRALDAELPRRLWQIDQHVDRCVAAKRVNLGIAKVKLIPDLGCQVVGQVTRGAIRLGGHGDQLTITMPVHAEIAAQKVGGVVSKTATGDATVHAVARLSIAGDWRPTARVTIDYDWTNPPGIDLLGQRIEFVDKADERLKPIVDKLERTLPRELAKLDLHDKLGSVWRRAFTSIELNRDRPPAWMRITPRRLGFGGYRIEGSRLNLLLSAEALTETFVGNRPADPVPTSLPPPGKTLDQPGLRFFIPVVADYAQLEPVVKRALEKRAAKGIVLVGIGPVDARFGKVIVYATTNGRLAIGVEADVKARGSALLATKGKVWLTALPYNQTGSQRVLARDVMLTSDADSQIANMVVALFNDTSIRETIAQGLAHDFAPDYTKVLNSARQAIGARQEGDFLLAANITDVRNGVIAVTGRGLFLPIRLSGEATIVYRPHRTR